MTGARFGWGDLYGGSRFLAPLSEEALLAAGVAAGLAPGDTVLDLACGNGAASVLLAEEFHVYARGVEAAAELVAAAEAHARRSPARSRLRFFHGDAGHPDGAHGPVDTVLALRGGGAPRGLVRAGGTLVLGRFLAPPRLKEAFASPPPLPGEPRWRREATPLEWERFLVPQERALRAYRDRLVRGDRVSPVALAADRLIHAFRAHAAQVRYELVVVPAAS